MSEAVIAKKEPFAVKVEAGKKYAWCACGLSSSQPLCDGTHKETAFTPIVFAAEKSETLYFCGCKRTGGAPMCDGTHKTL